MKKIGIAIYPEKAGIKPTLEYIEEAGNLGFKRIFANLLEVKKSDTDQLDMYKKVGTCARDKGKVIYISSSKN